MRMILLYYNCTFALFIFRLHKLGIYAYAYAHYTSLLCSLLYLSTGLIPEVAVNHGVVRNKRTPAARPERTISSLGKKS